MAQAGIQVQQNKLSLEYIAGFVDGEGCINIYKRKHTSTTRGYAYSLDIEISNTNKEIIELIHSTLGVGHITEVKNNEKNKNWRNGYLLRMSCKDAGIVIKKLLPYLVLKKPQAELALKFQKNMYYGHSHLLTREWNFREMCYDEMKELNKRGGV